MPAVSARAYANNAVVFLAWRYDAPIPRCLGFRLTRVNTATGRREVLPAWVGFEGQNNPQWKHRDTGVWPVQKFTWRDLTPEPGATYTYEITPMLGDPDANGKVTQPLTPDNTVENSITTNPVQLTRAFAGGAVTACFNNGILSTQFLARTLDQIPGGAESKKNAFLNEVRQPDNALRAKMTGDVQPLMLTLLDRARTTPGSTLFAALYELSDEELIGRLDGNAAVHLILTNTGPDDAENKPARDRLHRSGIGEILDRDVHTLGSNIGHNKFVVYVAPDGTPEAVFTGSTNWTPNGLCAQSNNALLVQDRAVARAYLDYWQRLKADGAAMGDALRQADGNAGVARQPLGVGGTNVTVWYSPNTPLHHRPSRGPAPEPADLGEVFRLMEAAQKVILFAVFQPGFPSVVSKALDLKTQTADTATPLLVRGVVSMPSALPKEDARSAPASVRPRRGAPITLIGAGNAADPVAVPASAINDPVGAFEKELLSAGNAIVHDKIVVVDPLGSDPIVITGSHNLGYKASYENDENLLIFRGSRELAVAYAVHVLDLYDHYRFRFLQAQLGASSGFKGFLTGDAQKWQAEQLGGALSREYTSYWAG